jgi:hypothetical protein
VIEWGQVDPDDMDHCFREAGEQRLGPLPELWLVTHGYRGLEEQGALYAKYKAGGPKAAPPGLSPHNYGLATEHRARRGRQDRRGRVLGHA